MLVTSDWLETFSAAWVQNVAAILSDHSMLVLHCADMEVNRSRPFQFENSWRQLNECRAIVADCWGPPTTLL